MALADPHPRDFPVDPADSRALARRRSEADTRSFLRMVSHELRTPLNAVIGFSELIARELHGPIGDPRYAEHARMIRQSGLTLLSLFNQVIDLARLEQGAMDLSLGDEVLEEVAAEALGDVAAAAADRGVRLVRMLDAAADRVNCDRRGLRKVLGALLCNAVAASPPGGSVTLTTRRRGDRVFLEVRDDGPGLDPADIPRLMRPFEQGENALVRRTEGAGLGLPIARLLSKAMGGRLHLDAELGAGRARHRAPALPPRGRRGLSPRARRRKARGCPTRRKPPSRSCWTSSTSSATTGRSATATSSTWAAPCPP